MDGHFEIIKFLKEQFNPRSMIGNMVSQSNLDVSRTKNDFEEQLVESEVLVAPENIPEGDEQTASNNKKIYSNKRQCGQMEN